ncbi:hypothetical protein HELRODRAFT_177251 [Helobdella robusta]|uniref:THAP9-like helix-turn-helix domain-containing protein n=1 Tax=Helobdella robusta TaxID=6412 RepID=T1FBE8_HELRO|nr:hypothetical protein HELRODRAFT_177251 [Helobdella robusta]ESN98368.1 hypothetical protein HELRODRAFT_177251 [Helobdella robusta]
MASIKNAKTCSDHFCNKDYKGYDGERKVTLKKAFPCFQFKKIRTYDSDQKSFALTLHLYGHKAYDYLWTNGLHLPHTRTLRKVEAEYFFDFFPYAPRGHENQNISIRFANLFKIIMQTQALRDFVNEKYSRPSAPLLNGFVYFLIQKQLKKIPVWVKIMEELESFNIVFSAKIWNVKTRIKLIHKQLTTFKLNLGRTWDQVVQYLEEPFYFQPIGDSEKQPVHCGQPTNLNPEAPSCSSTDAQVCEIRSTTSAQLPKRKVPQIKHICKSCIAKNLRIKNYKQTIFRLKQRIDKLSSFQRTKWRLQHLAKRRLDSVDHWKSKYHREKDMNSQAVSSNATTIKSLRISRSQIRKCQRRSQDRQVFFLYFPKITFFRNNNRNEITKSLWIGINQEEVIVQFQALGIIGKIITGPWMTLVYRNIRGLSNLEMGSVFQLGKSVIEGVLHHPAEVMLMKTDVFGHPLEEDDVHLSLMNKVYNNDMLYKLLISLMQSVIEVMERQMGNYLTGELSNPAPQMIADTSSAPPHNIHAERTLGLSDFFIRKSPYATIGFVDAKVKAKMNHTMDWLDAKSEQEQNKIIKFAITRGAKVRHISKDTERQTDLAILERRRQLSQKTEDKDRKKTEHAVLKLLINNGNSNDPLFASLDKQQKVFLDDILAGRQLIGKLLYHKWSMGEKEESRFIGRIQDRKKKKKDTFTISYWEVDEESAEDHKLPVESLITDLINGDLEFFT